MKENTNMTLHLSDELNELLCTYDIVKDEVYINKCLYIQVFILHVLGVHDFLGGFEVFSIGLF